jgi:two-component system sensor histidine kinase UhpB
VDVRNVKRSWLSRLWFGRSVRHQLIFVVAVTMAFATFAAGTIAVVNGREAVDIETRASIDFAERYVRALVQRLSAENALDRIETLLPAEIGTVRHAQVWIIRDNAEPKLVEPIPSLTSDSDLETPAPPWFRSLMMPKDAPLLKRYVSTSDQHLSILVLGHAEDEINEVWRELSALALVWGGVIALLLIGLHLIMGWILQPLVALERGLTALEEGQRRQRLPVPKVHELAEISQKFNSLAASLDQTRDENGTLYRQMMDLQEEERRQIARELHDEAGPCLFGITANTESIDRLTSDLPASEASRIRNRTAEILAVVERLKSMNRTLLRRLRPISVGKVSIHGLITELIRDFERRHPDVRFISTAEIFSRSYGDTVDLTVYRCVQEALTNAIRHGHATSCIVHLEEAIAPDGGASSGKPIRILLTIRDNGTGLKPGTEIGFGLAAMRERVLSVGGTWSVGENWPSGTMITVKIPAALDESRAEAVIPQITPQHSERAQ